MKLPYTFEDMTLSQFMKLHELEQDKSIDLLDKQVKKLSILSGKSIEYIETLDIKDIKNYLTKVSYTSNAPTEMRVVPRFRVKGTMLKPTLSLQEMKVNQLVDFYGLLKASDGKYIQSANKLLAVMFKPLKLFRESVYSPENHAKISELLLSAKVGDCLGLLFFYLNFWKRCAPVMSLYLENNNKVISELMNEIMNDKEFMDSLTNGVGNITSTNVQKVRE